MDILNKIFENALLKKVKEATSEDEVNQIFDGIPQDIENILSSVREDLYKNIKSEAWDKLRQDREFHMSFVKRNYKRWKEGFDLLQLLIEISIEAGNELNKRVRPKASKNNDILFDVLVRLQAKACLISNEITTLLYNGFPDGAHARWRTLHEVNVISRFISKNGLKAAERYYYHEIRDIYKVENQFRHYESKLNIKEFNEEQHSTLKEYYEQLNEKYGENFDTPYGWAAPFFNHKYIKFDELERVVKLDHWRPYYKRASHNIHSTMSGLKNSLGLIETNEDMLLVGPSSSGMVNPTHSTAISLSQITINLLKYQANLDSVIIMKIILLLSKEVGDEILKCGNI